MESILPSFDTEEEFEFEEHESVESINKSLSTPEMNTIFQKQISSG